MIVGVCVDGASFQVIGTGVQVVGGYNNIVVQCGYHSTGDVIGKPSRALHVHFFVAVHIRGLSRPGAVEVAANGRLYRRVMSRSMQVDFAGNSRPIDIG